MIEMNETLIAMNTSSVKQDLVTRTNGKLRLISYSLTISLAVRVRVRCESYESYYKVVIDKTDVYRHLAQLNITLKKHSDNTDLVIHQKKYLFTGIKFVFVISKIQILKSIF